jgi:hypothetical protein
MLAATHVSRPIFFALDGDPNQGSSVGRDLYLYSGRLAIKKEMP